MLSKKLGGITLVLLLLLTVVLSTSVLATALPSLLQAGSMPAVWGLTNARVVDPGKTMILPEGTLTSGFTIEAMAIARTNAPVSSGKFLLTLSAFLPSKDMPGQKAGRWYVRGTWSIANANAALGKARYRPGLVKGDLLAELTFNPATQLGAFSAQVRVPGGPINGTWSSGQGTLSLNNRFDGQLYLTLTYPTRSQGSGEE